MRLSPGAMFRNGGRMKWIAVLPLALLTAACQARAPVPAFPSLPGPISSPIALPDERPVWEVFQRLECRGTTFRQCFHGSNRCVPDRSTAHIIVDFSGTVTWVGNSNPQQIVGRTFRRGVIGRGVHVPPQSTIYLSEASKAIDFGGLPNEAADRLDPGTFAATMTSTNTDRSFIYFLRCRPVP